MRINSKSASFAVAAAIIALCVIFSDSLPFLKREAVDGNLTVTFIDVGQGDSIFFEFPDGKRMLIDAGTQSGWKSLNAFLDSRDDVEIDVFVGTHPHEDHIGCADDVIGRYEIGAFYMPDIEHSTKNYESVMLAAEQRGVAVTVPEPDEILLSGDGYEVRVLAPRGEDYKDLNDWSIVLRVTYGDTSFLLMGDAEAISEREMVDAGCELESTVLKVGHHGSDSSTSYVFLREVNPAYAVISCAKDNQYGHPHENTMSRLSDAGATVYRTDTDGTITAVSDGETVTFKKAA